MADLKLESKSTFEKQTFSQVPIPGNRGEGLKPSLSVWISDEKDKLLIVKNNYDVVVKITGENLKVFNL